MNTQVMRKKQIRKLFLLSGILSLIVFSTFLILKHKNSLKYDPKDDIKSEHKSAANVSNDKKDEAMFNEKVVSSLQLAKPSLPAESIKVVKPVAQSESQAKPKVELALKPAPKPVPKSELKPVQKPQIQTKPVTQNQSKIINHLLPLANSGAHSKTDDITHIVIHFSSNISGKPNDPYNPEDVINIFKQYGVSAHYLISRDGTIYRLVDESRNAYHAGKGSLIDYPQYKDKLNRHSIGIEILAIGAQEEMKQYVSAGVYQTIPKSNIGYAENQYTALNSLLPGIYKRYDIKIDRKHVIGHEEYSSGAKEDPGVLFDWSKIGL